MKHKDRSKCKIQKRHKNVYLYNHRKFYWRIDPKELNLWERIFKNPWRLFKHVLYGDKLFYVYAIDDYNEQLKPLVTYEDAVKYQESEYNKAKIAHEQYVKEGLIWED